MRIYKIRKLYNILLTCNIINNLRNALVLKLMVLIPMGVMSYFSRVQRWVWQRNKVTHFRLGRQSRTILYAFTSLIDTSSTILLLE